MRKTVVCVVIAVFVACSYITAEETGKRRVAVMDLKGDTALPELGMRLAEIMRILITEFHGYKSMDRSMLVQIAEKKSMVFGSINDAAAAVDLLDGENVDVVIVGSIGLLQRKHSVNVKLINPANGSIIRAAGVEFEEMHEVRVLFRGLLQRILDMQNISGKPYISENEIRGLEKKSHTALSLSIGSTVVEGAIIGTSLLLSQTQNPYYAVTGAAMLLPPIAPLYTGDWDHTPYTIGFSAGSGFFVFVGSLLRGKSDDSAFRHGFGTFLLYNGIVMKGISVFMDILSAPRAVKRYNRDLRAGYFIARQEKKSPPVIFPVFGKNYLGLHCTVSFNAGSN